METDCIPLNEDILACPFFRDDVDSLNPEEKFFSLALFNFFGTLVWGESGKLYDYDRVVLSSPICKERFTELNEKGYSICILEYVPRKKISAFLRLVKLFIQQFYGRISIFCFLYTKEPNPKIQEGLIKFFNPFNGKFGKNSFYCGDNLHKLNTFPWYRNFNKDMKLSETLRVKFYEPADVIGIYDQTKILPNMLYITTGQYYSGYEIEYESFRGKKEKDGKVFLYKNENGVEVYAIQFEEIDWEDSISISENQAVIVFGQNPTLFQRNIIRSKFKEYSKSIVRWYARYPYKKPDSFDSFCKAFENPLLMGEYFERAN